MNKYLLSLLLLAPISFMYAQESSDADDEVEEIVVTGIKQSLKDAIDIKRKNVGVVDAITSEDIGKFPDGNLAESLARIVGVTTERSNNEGTKVSVRGLGPEFNLVTLNGRSMPTVPGVWGGGRSFDFGAVSSHGVSAVEVYKSANAILPTGGIGSTINMVTTKPLDGSNGGAFSVRAMHETSVETGDEYTPEVDFVFIRNGEVFNGGQWGAAVSGSHQVRHNREKGTNEITWLPSPERSHLNANAVIENNNTREDGAYFYPESLYYKFKDNERTRDNAQVTFQYEQGIVRATLDYTYSATTMASDGRESGSYFAGYNADFITINENGAVISGSEGANLPIGDSYQARISYGEEDSVNRSLGLNLDFAISDSLTLIFDMHNSSAMKKGQPGGNLDNHLDFSNGANDPVNPIDWQSGGSAGDINRGGVQSPAGFMRQRGFDFNNPVGGLYWVMNRLYGDQDLGVTRFDGRDIGPRQAFLHYQDKRSDMTQKQLLLTWDNLEGKFWDGISSIDFGYSDLDTTYLSKKWFNQLVNGKIADGNPFMLTYDLLPDDVFSRIDLPNYLGSGQDFYIMDAATSDAIYWFTRAGYVSDSSSTDGSPWNASTPSNWPVSCRADDAVDADGNPNGLLDDATGQKTTQRGILCYGDIDSDNTITESLKSLFVNFNIDTETPKGQEIRAQLGLRYEKVEQLSTSFTEIPVNTAWSLGDFDYGQRVGLITAPGVYFSVPGESDYFLPNFNMTFEYAENKIIRLSASKTISRPDLEQMRSSTEIGSTDTRSPIFLNVGNPDLEPYEAINYDFAWEYYYKDASYVAANYFHKELDGYHGYEQTQGPYNGVTDVTRGSRGQYITSENDGRLCEIHSWACGWSTAYDYAWWFVTNPGQTPDNYDSNGNFTCKDLENCIANPGILFNHDNAVHVGSAEDPLYIFNIGMPTNRFGGTIEGLELAVQHTYDNGFGVIANLTFVDGDTNADPSIIGEQFALGGFGDAGNFAVFYENETYSARLSYNWKGETFAGMDQYNPLWVEERGQVDFSATYNLNDKGAVFFEAVNVTDEEVRLYSRYEEMLFLFQDHGSIYKLGFRYKF